MILHLSDRVLHWWMGLWHLIWCHLLVDNYQLIFTEHLKNLNKFNDHTKAQGLLPKLLAELHDNGRWVPLPPVILWSNSLPCYSINARGGPLDHSTTCTMSPSAFNAAIEEFLNGDGDSSDSGEEHDWFNVVEVVKVCRAIQSIWAIYDTSAINELLFSLFSLSHCAEWNCALWTAIEE